MLNKVEYIMMSTQSNQSLAMSVHQLGKNTKYSQRLVQFHQQDPQERMQSWRNATGRDGK